MTPATSWFCWLTDLWSAKTSDCVFFVFFQRRGVATKDRVLSFSPPLFLCALQIAAPAELRCAASPGPHSKPPRRSRVVLAFPRIQLQWRVPPPCDAASMKLEIVCLRWPHTPRRFDRGARARLRDRLSSPRVWSDHEVHRYREPGDACS